MQIAARRKTLAMIGIAAICLVLLSYAYFIEPNRLVVRNREIVIKGWNRAFDGLRIVAVSDIHGGSNGGDAENIQRIVETINAQDPDIVVLLGDYVSNNTRRTAIKMPMSEIAANLRGISAKYGVFAVLGNHDGWFDDNAVAEGLRSVGIAVLQNEMGIIEINGRKLRIFGMKDHLQMGSWRAFDAEIRNAVASYPQDGDIIVLEHSPDVFPVINQFNTFGDDFKLMLAGHTHGGQVWLPVIGSPIVPSSYGQKYNYGHIVEDGRNLFVTTGTGTSILPFRFMTPPEIAVLTLTGTREP